MEIFLFTFDLPIARGTLFQIGFAVDFAKAITISQLRGSNFRDIAVLLPAREPIATDAVRLFARVDHSAAANAMGRLLRGHH
jgi:hypothetical protein